MYCYVLYLELRNVLSVTFAPKQNVAIYRGLFFVCELILIILCDENDFGIHIWTCCDYQKEFHCKPSGFQFDCTNTLNDQVLERVTVQMDPAEGFDVLKTIPCPSLPYNKPGTTYTLVRLPEDAQLGKEDCASYRKKQNTSEIMGILLSMKYRCILCK